MITEAEPDAVVQPPPTLAVDAFSVPVEALAELRRLSLGGRPRALRARLDALAREHPDLEPLCAQWIRLADDFDFDTLNRQLRIPDDR